MAAFSTTMASGGPARVRVPGKYIVMSAAAALLVIFGGASLLRNVGHAPAPSAESAEPAAIVGNVVKLPEFLVDLAPDASGRISYIRLAAAVVVPEKNGASAAEHITTATPEISERINFLLRGLTPEDFSGEAGMIRVKAELLRRVNLVIAPDKAEDVIVSDIVIQ